MNKYSVGILYILLRIIVIFVFIEVSKVYIFYGGVSDFLHGLKLLVSFYILPSDTFRDFQKWSRMIKFEIHCNRRCVNISIDGHFFSFL